MSLTLTATDDELLAQFAGLLSRRSLATMLEVDYSSLMYHLYISKPDSQYVTFTIPKQSGGVREITAPNTPLKILQQKLNQVLQAVYRPRHSVHGFVQDRSIRSNALQHSRQRYVFNIDLKDFFLRSISDGFAACSWRSHIICPPK